MVRVVAVNEGLGGGTHDLIEENRLLRRQLGGRP
jgi:hypothetical protein